MTGSIERAEVAVLGAGLLAWSAAAHLAGAGVRVTLVDPVGVRGGASKRAVAYLAHPYDAVQVPLFEASLRLMLDAGVSIPRSPAGVLALADRRGPAAAVRDEMAVSHPELAPELLDPEDLRSTEPGLGVSHWACLLATGYPVCPRRATEIFAERAAHDGAAVLSVSRPSLTWEGRRCVGVAWDGGAVICDRVIVAAGAATAGVIDCGGSWAPVAPLWGVDVALRLQQPPRRVLVEAALAQAQRARGGGAQVESGFSFAAAYGRCSMGATFLTSEPVPDRWLGRLSERGRSFLPRLAEAEVTAVSACARPQSVDGRPLLGHVRGADGLLVATGTGSRGISLGAECGRLAASAARARSDECIPRELRADRFPLNP